MTEQVVEQKKIPKIKLRKIRRNSRIEKTLKNTARNKILKNKFKKSKREFINSTKESMFSNFKDYMSTIGKLLKHKIIKKGKAARLQSSASIKFNSKI